MMQGAPRGLREARHRMRGAVDATREPDPGPAPEAVFDRLTGPHRRCTTVTSPGRRACDEDV
jgi:hypothetical protein